MEVTEALGGSAYVVSGRDIMQCTQHPGAAVLYTHNPVGCPICALLKATKRLRTT